MRTGGAALGARQAAQYYKQNLERRDHEEIGGQVRARVSAAACRRLLSVRGAGGSASASGRSGCAAGDRRRSFVSSDVRPPPARRRMNDRLGRALHSRWCFGLPAHPAEGAGEWRERTPGVLTRMPGARLRAKSTRLRPGLPLQCASAHDFAAGLGGAGRTGYSNSTGTGTMGAPGGCWRQGVPPPTPAGTARTSASWPRPRRTATAC